MRDHITRAALALFFALTISACGTSSTSGGGSTLGNVARVGCNVARPVCSAVNLACGFVSPSSSTSPKGARACPSSTSSTSSTSTSSTLDERRPVAELDAARRMRWARRDLPSQ
jgi:hypothetical protein